MPSGNKSPKSFINVFCGKPIELKAKKIHPIGMMEYWIIGFVLIGMSPNFYLKSRLLPNFRPIIPVFHYSNIPFG